MPGGLVAPSPASCADKMPFSAALPGWMLFVMSPDSKKVLRPAACVPARPSVRRAPSASSRSALAALAAAPKVPLVAVECQKR